MIPCKSDDHDLRDEQNAMQETKNIFDVEIQDQSQINFATDSLHVFPSNR